jgi:hypothetical protein
MTAMVAKQVAGRKDQRSRQESGVEFAIVTRRNLESSLAVAAATRGGRDSRLHAHWPLHFLVAVCPAGRMVRRADVRSASRLLAPPRPSPNRRNWPRPPPATTMKVTGTRRGTRSAHLVYAHRVASSDNGAVGFLCAEWSLSNRFPHAAIQVAKMAHDSLLQLSAQSRSRP